jgi:hypothetical protein
MRILKKHYEPREWTLTKTERVENGLLGIRVWRVA